MKKGTYIVTERLHGDEGEGKMALLESFSSKAGAEWYRKEILKRRFSKAIFNEPINDPVWRRQQREGLEIWKKA